MIGSTLRFATFVTLACTNVAFAEISEICDVPIPDTELTDFLDHGLGYVSYQIQLNKKSFKEITYRFEDCTTGEGLDIKFVQSQRKKKSYNGINAVTVSRAVHEVIKGTHPSWISAIDEVEQKLLEIGVKPIRVMEEEMTCVCKTAYVEIQR